MDLDNWQRCYLRSHSPIWPFEHWKWWQFREILDFHYVTNHKTLLLHHNFTIHPSTGVYESRILSSIYYYELLPIVSTYGWTLLRKCLMSDHYFKHCIVLHLPVIMHDQVTAKLRYDIVTEENVYSTKVCVCVCVCVCTLPVKFVCRVSINLPIPTSNCCSSACRSDTVNQTPWNCSN